ncbi:MAG: DNA (cytosine-5-)-methyltransferase, partial [Caulobacteraceae bacterium]|nr:DNA (cytosine-5-)-methyltransferase [Caulobacteraceae bacterium]
LLVGGTPCQSFSVAGLRRGMADPRGNLALTYLAIADRYKPRWIVWENVPGVLSSAGGRDFGSFLGALGQLGYGWAYRVLDARFFGVAQRRRRVFVTGYLGDWRRAAAVLFESTGGGRHPETRRKKGETVAPTVVSCPPFSRTGNARVESDALVARMVAFGEYVDDGTASAMKARDYKDATDLVAQPMMFKVRGGVEREDGSRGSTNVGKQAGKGFLGSTDRAFTVASTQDQWVAQPVAFHVDAQPDQMNFSSETTASLTCSQHAGVQMGMAVRRLTPTECERLQGFPDGYTNIRENCPDGPRYKALGNSMAVPVMRWIGERIQTIEGLTTVLPYSP